MNRSRSIRIPPRQPSRNFGVLVTEGEPGLLQSTMLTREDVQPARMVVCLSDDPQPAGSIGAIEDVGISILGIWEWTVRWEHLPSRKWEPWRNRTTLREEDLGKFALATPEQIEATKPYRPPEPKFKLVSASTFMRRRSGRLPIHPDQLSLFEDRR